VAFGFSAAMSILSLTVSFYMLQVYDRVLTSRSIETLILLTIIAVGGVSVFAALDALRLRLLVRTGMKIGDALAPRVLRAMVSSSAQIGGPAARQGLRDVDTIRNFIGSPGFGALLDAPFLLLFLIVLFLLHWAYFVIVLVGGAILIGIAVTDQYMTSRTLTRSIAVSIKSHNFAEDGLRNADVLEGMGMSHTFTTRWRGHWLDSLKLSLASTDKDSLLNGISKAVRLIIQIVLLGVGALLVLDYHASGGVMIGASILGSRALAPIEATVATWKSIVAVRGAWTRVGELLERAPKREEGMPLPAPTGRLEVQRVGYMPPGARKPILNSVSFDLQPGDSVGVIGPSASGKSTLTRLLVGAWPCTAGSVRLDGADIYAWPRQELSHYIGYLPQDVELFTGTVRDNIARLTEGSPEAIVRAARLANAHEMILALPNGYDTEIGENGQKLSGGQRQRIGIARALYGDPKLIALDEPNSNLDATGEEALAATLVELKKLGVTVIVVAHRPSILGSVDKMLVMRDGLVEAFGPRDEVMRKFTRGAPQRAQGGAPPAPQTNVVSLSAAMTYPAEPPKDGKP
ncbi:MAG TPA: type I secretion system permease/ATPase, partial [Rhizomicrobium sp.]|nr:type I secretion system permease/ATPase [Rhizomicrobium sp.]